MRKAVVWLVILGLIGYAIAQWSTAYKAQTDLEQRIEYHLNFVDDTSTNSIKQDVIHDAQKFGIALTPANITVLCQATAVQSLAQQLVGGRLGTQFVNKRVTIEVHYTARVFGLPLNEEIARSKIRQVEVHGRAPDAETKSALDGTQ